MTTIQHAIDLNADLGEEVGDDGAMLALVSSTSIACGAHAGRPLSIAAAPTSVRARGAGDPLPVRLGDRARDPRRRVARGRRSLRRPHLSAGRHADAPDSARGRDPRSRGSHTHVLRMLDSGQVAAADGTPLQLAMGSLCLHGDTPGAVALAQALRTAIEGAGWCMAAFAA